MKKIAILLIACVMCIGHISAQGYDYLGLGYNMGFLRSEGLDFVVDRYNETRPYLNDQMEQPRYFDGFAIHGGVGRGLLLLNLGYTQQSSKVSAEGTDATATTVQRDLKNKWNTFDLGIGLNIADGDRGAFGLGVNMGLNSEKALTRTGAPDDIGKEKFEEVQKQFKVGFSPFVQIILTGDSGTGLLIRPYYAWSPMTTDYTELNAAINPATAAGDPTPLEGDLKGFGITLLVVSMDGY